MPQTYYFTVTTYAFVAGANIENPLGYRIRISSEEDQNFRLYFFSPDPIGSEFIGWRASDRALVVFLSPQDYAPHLLLLDQAKALHIRVVIDGPEDNEIVTDFELSTVHSGASAGVARADATEFKKRRKARK